VKQQLFIYVIYIAYDNVYQYWTKNKIFIFIYLFIIIIFSGIWSLFIIGACFGKLISVSPCLLQYTVFIIYPPSLPEFLIFINRWFRDFVIHYTVLGHCKIYSHLTLFWDILSIPLGMYKCIICLAKFYKNLRNLLIISQVFEVFIHLTRS
jgi:hypothetical protein